VTANHGTTTATDNSTITANQTSSTTFGVNSNNPDTGDFTFSSISWGFFDATNTFVGTGGNVGNSLVMALNGTAGKTIKVEVQNTAGAKKVFNLTLAAGQQNYTFDLTGFTQPLAAINFVSDTVGATHYAVETKGLNYIPFVTGVYGPDTAITTLPGNPVVPTDGKGHGTTT